MSAADITPYLEQGISITNRLIDLTGDITEEKIALCCRALDIMMEIDKEDITITINSYGGSIYDGLAFIDTINKAKTRGIKIITQGRGKVMSMALIIFLHGDSRIGLDNVSFMAHSASSGAYGKVSEMDTELDEVKCLNELLTAMLSERTRRKLPFWTKKLKYENYYFNNEEALKLGVSNAVWKI